MFLALSIFEYVSFILCSKKKNRYDLERINTLERMTVCENKNIYIMYSHSNSWFLQINQHRENTFLFRIQVRYLTLIITLVPSTVLVESTSSILELVFWVTIRRERDFNDLGFYVCELHMQVIELSSFQGLLLPVQSYWIFPRHLGSECLQYLKCQEIFTTLQVRVSANWFQWTL